jgi:hypothetical protein
VKLQYDYKTCGFKKCQVRAIEKWKAFIPRKQDTFSRDVDDDGDKRRMVGTSCDW